MIALEKYVPAFALGVLLFASAADVATGHYKHFQKDASSPAPTQPVFTNAQASKSALQLDKR